MQLSRVGPLLSAGTPHYPQLPTRAGLKIEKLPRQGYIAWPLYCVQFKQTYQCEKWTTHIAHTVQVSFEHCVQKNSKCLALKSKYLSSLLSTG